MPQAVEALEKAKADVTEFTTLPVAGKFGQMLSLPCVTRLPWRVFAEELKELAGTTHVLQSETGGAEEQAYSLFQVSSSVGTKRSAHFTGPEVVTVVREADALTLLGCAHFCNLEVWYWCCEDTFAKFTGLQN